MVLSGGGQLTRRQHLLSHDGRQLLVCMANAVRVYSTATAELLFEMHGHTDEVTDLCLDPASPTQIYSSSRDGTIAQWDLQTGTQLASWPVIGEPVESVCVPAAGGPAILAVSWRQAAAGRALAFDLALGAARPSRIKLSRPRPVVAAAGGALVATHDRHTILVWAPANFGASPPMALHHTKAITCVAVSPDGAKLAAGDATGRILIWHDVAATLAARAAELAAHKARQQEAARGNPNSNINPNSTPDGDDSEEEAMDLVEPPAATVHWHAHAVGALTFSLDGKYLLSGGQEAVLVIWDVGTGRRTYLPRLGGPLTGVAPCPSDPALYAVRQADNTVRVINAAAMTVEASLHGVRPLPRGHAAAGAAPPPLALAPGSGLAVVTGPHAVLQWYDLGRDAHVDKLALSVRSVVSLSEADAAAAGGVYGPPPEPAAVEVAFSRDGGAMATVETRPDPAGGGAVQHALKFWDRAPPGQATYGSPYLLNTLADQPHRSAAGFGAVTSLAFHPTEDVAATTSDSGEFKVWVRQTVGQQRAQRGGSDKENEAAKPGAPGSTWRCAAVGSHRGEPLTAAAFSGDGSVLALGAAAGGISLWDARQTALLGVLPPAFAPGAAPAAAAAVRRLRFVAGTPLLVAALAGGLAVFNLLTMRCEWAVQVEGVGALAADPSSPHWAAVLGALPPSGGGGQGRKKGAPGAGGAGKEAREQGVVVFRGAGEAPAGAWRLRRAGPAAGVALAFAPAGTPLAAAAAEAGVCLPGCSPLVVLSGDREYAVARRPGAEAAEAPAGTAGAGLAAAAAEGPSGFQSMYGRSARVDAAAQAAAAAAAGGGGDAGAARPAWAALFDAPSHALPAMGTLCPAFLEAMVIGGAPAAGQA